MCSLIWNAAEEPFSEHSSRKSKSLDEVHISTCESTHIGWSSSSFDSSPISLTCLRDLLPDNPKIYRFKEIAAATNQFRSGKIGKSSVWICNLRGKSVVVTERDQRNVEDFKTRLREICIVHHSSIINLLGGCYEGDHLYLGYEYVDGMNLRDCLRSSKTSGYTVLSTWMSRMQIAIDVAQGLEYMHHDTALNYVHNHIKSSSIIVLKPDFRAKIAHLGASYLAGELLFKASGHIHKIRALGSTSEDSEITKENPSGQVPNFGGRRRFEITGPQGYVAPEYEKKGIVSKKTDVFAFGMILLELLSGNEPVRLDFDAAHGQFRRISLIETANIILSEPGSVGKVRAWIDPRLNDSFPIDCAEKVVRLASFCMDMDPESRPTMRYVAGELSKGFWESKRWWNKCRPVRA